MAEFTFEWPGPEKRKVRQTIVVLDDSIKDFRPIWKIIIPNMRAKLSVGFRRMVDAIDGSPWPSLTPQYEKRKEKTHPGKPILVRTGALKRALTKKGAAGQIVIMKKRSMIFGADVGIYGIVHQTTTRRRKDGVAMRRSHTGIKLRDLALMFEFAIKEVVRKQFKRIKGARVRR